jgi:branched-chain amino acid transport system permease protein
VLLYVLMGGTQTVWGPLFGAAFFTLVPEALRKLSELDASLKFLEGGRFMLFGVAVVLIMMVRPQGVITRTLIERLFSRTAGGRHAGQDGSGRSREAT